MVWGHSSFKTVPCSLRMLFTSWCYHWFFSGQVNSWGGGWGSRIFLLFMLSMIGRWRWSHHFFNCLSHIFLHVWSQIGCDGSFVKMELLVLVLFMMHWRVRMGCNFPRRVFVVLRPFNVFPSLMRRGYSMAEWCSMCRCSGEIVDHLLLHCNIAHELWSFIFQSLGFSGCLQGGWWTFYSDGGIGLESTT